MSNIEWTPPQEEISSAFGNAQTSKAAQNTATTLDHVLKEFTTTGRKLMLSTFGSRRYGIPLLHGRWSHAMTPKNSYSYHRTLTFPKPESQTSEHWWNRQYRPVHLNPKKWTTKFKRSWALSVTPSLAMLTAGNALAQGLLAAALHNLVTKPHCKHPFCQLRRLYIRLYVWLPLLHYQPVPSTLPHGQKPGVFCQCFAHNLSYVPTTIHGLFFVFISPFHRSFSISAQITIRTSYPSHVYYR